MVVEVVVVVVIVIDKVDKKGEIEGKPNNQYMLISLMIILNFFQE